MALDVVDGCVRDPFGLSHLMETIRGVRTVRLFLQEDGRKTEWLSLAVDATNAAVRTQRLKPGRE